LAAGSVQLAPVTLVESASATTSGFTIEFNEAVDVGAINLYEATDPTERTGSPDIPVARVISATSSVAVTGSLVFVLMGFRHAALAPFDPRARRRALALATGVLLLISIPLALTSHRLIVTSKVALRTNALAREWLGDSGYQVLSVDAETADGSVKLLITGNGLLPPRHQLETRTLPLLLGHRLDVKVINAESFTIDGARSLNEAKPLGGGQAQVSMPRT
jgi:hypothetical protein